jgi:hypothetical protein
MMLWLRTMRERFWRKCYVGLDPVLPEEQETCAQYPFQAAWYVRRAPLPRMRLVRRETMPRDNVRV